MEVDTRIADPQARSFAFQECVSALYGMLECCKTLWVNDVSKSAGNASDEVNVRWPISWGEAGKDTAAEYKPYQLKIARECGFAVPDTLITNEPAAVMDFRNQHGGNIVYKAFNQRGLIWRPTRILRDEDLSLLDNLRHAPVIFQPVVPGIRDVRVTAIGPHIFATEFDIEKMDGVDYRLRMQEIPCRPHELPPVLEAQVRSFMARLGLQYGGIDFRLTHEGQYVFFEINTAGEFLYVEDRTGQPISEAMAAHLAAGRTTTAH